MWHTRQGTSLRLAVLETAALSKLRMHVVGFNVSPNGTWVIGRPTSFALNGIGASNGIRTRSLGLEGRCAANTLRMHEKAARTKAALDVYDDELNRVQPI